FVVRPGRDDVTRIDLGPAAPVADAIARWRVRNGVLNLTALKPDEMEPGSRLRELVWDKITPHLGDAKTVLVSPDGPLTGLPFAALPGAKPGTFLIEDGYAFATIPVPRL